MYDSLFNGCIAYYPGIVGSSGKYLDIIGGYDGTITGATRTGTDRFGTANQAMYFNGSSNVNLGNVSALKPTTAFTILAWVKTTSNTSTKNSPIWSCAYYGNYYDFLFAVKQTDIRLALQSSSSSWDANLTNCLTIENWYLISGVYSANSILKVGSNLTFSANTTPGQIAYSSTNIYIGTEANIGSTYSNYIGYLGELFFYNRVLSTAEIKTIYDLTKLQYIMPKVGYWK